MTKTECRACTNGLTALMDNEISPEEALVLEAHLRDCLSCRREYESLLFSYQLTCRMPEIEVSPNLWMEIRENLSSETLTSPLKLSIYRFLFSRPWVPATAVLCTAVVVLFLLVAPHEDNPVTNEFAAFVQQREILFKRDEGILFRDGSFNRYEPRRNPFMRQVQYTEQNPFRSMR
ncbi:MAG TPA: zf-HC2 domain-containing protein [Acidobacteriota bacterium]|nr:zf-HC2 domain-containing protein [Acidobacteriota bacterium]